MAVCTRLIDEQPSLIAHIAHIARMCLPFGPGDFWNGESTGGRPGINCTTVHTVENQGGCGSCWAFGSSEAFSDRTCIASEAKVDMILSPQEPTSCTGCMNLSKARALNGFDATCGYNGCGGGSPEKAWEFFAAEGLVSASCWPYEKGNTTVADGLDPNSCNRTKDPVGERSKVSTAATALQSTAGDLSPRDLLCKPALQTSPCGVAAGAAVRNASTNRSARTCTATRASWAQGPVSTAALGSHTLHRCRQSSACTTSPT